MNIKNRLQRVWMGSELRTFKSNSNILKHSNKNTVLFLSGSYFYSNQSNEKQNVSKLKLNITDQTGFELPTFEIYAKHPTHSAIKPAVLIKGVYMYTNKDNEQQIYY